MSGLLNRGADDATVERRACRALFAGGGRYENTAAKFWPALVDEVVESFPSCSTLSLSAPASVPLSSDDLSPSAQFARQSESLEHADVADLIRATVEESTLLGPPASVRVRLCSDDAELFSGVLPADSVDAEVFAFLTAWLLEWAGISEFVWNDERLSGDFVAEDRDRAREYRFSFTVTNTHLSEGLFERTIVFSPSVERLP